MNGVVAPPATNGAVGAAGTFPQPQSRERARPRLVRNHRLVPVLGVLSLIWIIFALLSDVFLTARNLTNLSLQIVVVAVLALALLQVLIVGEIDLAVVGTSAVSAGVFASLAVTHGVNVAVAIVAGALTGMIIGAIQGLIVTLFTVPSFIVTLGVSFALQGVLLRVLPKATVHISLQQLPFARIATTYAQGWLLWSLLAVVVAIYSMVCAHTYRGKKRHGLDTSVVVDLAVPIGALASVGSIIALVLGSHQGMPLLLVLTLTLYAAFAFVLTQTSYGVAMYAVGGNAQAAERSGVNVSRVKLQAFVLAGGLGAVGGIVAATRVLSVSPVSASTNLLLEAAAACIIGGVSLYGGRGSPWSALVGALVIGSVTNGLFLLAVDEYLRLFVNGTILVAAVLLDRVVSRTSDA